MNRALRSEMRGSTKAVAMLDLWASVKRARDEAPPDPEADEREVRPGRALDPAEGAPEPGQAE